MSVKKVSVKVGQDLFGNDSYTVKKVSVLPIGLSYVPELPKNSNPVNSVILCDYLSINQGYSVAYSLPLEKGFHSNVLGLNERNKPVNNLSRKSTVKIYNAIKWLTTISELKEVYSIKEKKSFKFKLCFITLTLSDSQKHSDQFIKKHMLEPFLKWMIYSYRCINFIWKAEVQDNGNIHFHITTNKFIHWRAIRKKWNRIQQNHGYTQKHGDENKQMELNSTDIHSVRSVKDIMIYFSKYMSKADKYKRSAPLNIQNKDFYYSWDNYQFELKCDGLYYPVKRRINGMMWNCSRSLKNTAILLNGQMDEYKQMESVMMNKELVSKVEKDYRCVYIHKKKLFNSLPESIRNEIKNRIKSARKADNAQLKIEIESFN